MDLKYSTFSFGISEIFFKSHHMVLYTLEKTLDSAELTEKNSKSAHPSANLSRADKMSPEKSVSKVSSSKVSPMVSPKSIFTLRMSDR